MMMILPLAVHCASRTRFLVGKTMSQCASLSNHPFPRFCIPFFHASCRWLILKLNASAGAIFLVGRPISDSSSNRSCRTCVRRPSTRCNIGNVLNIIRRQYLRRGWLLRQVCRRAVFLLKRVFFQWDVLDRGHVTKRSIVELSRCRRAKVVGGERS